MSVPATVRPTHRQCEVCGTAFPLDYSHGIQVGLAKKFCSHKCRGIGRRGERIPVKDRFWDKVDKNGPLPPHCPELGPCWVWTRARDSRGAGKIGIGGGRTTLLAYRVSYEREFGAIPEGMLVLHHCDTPACVRPSHLFLADAGVKARDMIAKGKNAHLSDPARIKRGEDSPFAVLTEELVREIRRRKQSGEKKKQVAQILGVPIGAVDGVWYNRSWRDVV